MNIMEIIPNIDLEDMEKEIEELMNVQTIDISSDNKYGSFKDKMQVKCKEMINKV